MPRPAPPAIPAKAVETAAQNVYEHTSHGMDACRLLAHDAITAALPYLLPELTELELLRRQRAAVLDVLRACWHAARRWEDPNPVPGWIRVMLAALEVEGPACDCLLCAGSDARWAEHHSTAARPVSYSGWAIQDREDLLARLAAAGITPVHPTVDCEHVTRSYPDTRPAPDVATVRLIGVAADNRVQALVAEVDGTTLRPDGRRYHATLALADGAEPVESNDLLARPGVFAPIIPITVAVAPFLRTLED